MVLSDIIILGRMVGSVNDKLKMYFKNMFADVDKNIVLDDDQINAILNNNDYVLILAGAGTGKTTTMVGKVKYLVDIKKVDPSKILVISYTKKAVEDLQSLIIDEFGINTTVTTFHSLAYKYVRNIFKNRKCIVIDDNKREDIFYNFINKLFEQDRIKELIDVFNTEILNNINFIYSNYFEKNYSKHKNYDSLFESYKRDKIEEAKSVGIKGLIEDWVQNKLNNDEEIITIKGEVVKSASEAVIANFLFKHGINYEYEKVYDKLVTDRKIYRPDFTLELAGIPVYLEFFGMDDVIYNRIKKRKIELHKRYHNKFIYLENVKLEDIEKVLDEKLKEMHFIYKDRTDEEIYGQILDNSKLSQIYGLRDLFYDTIEKIKENLDRERYKDIVINYLSSINNPSEKDILFKQFKLFNEFYVYYSKELITSDIYGFDYADLIYYSNKYIRSKEFLNNLNYEYIIIDEYQDISDGEYMLARNTSDKCKSKVFAVGDDWQSIYSFRGSNIGYITMFSKYFSKPTILSIRTTYRNSQELVDIAGEFITRNTSQINKRLIAKKHLFRPLKFIKFDDRIDENRTDDYFEYAKLKELVLRIHELHPERSILILGRTNQIIDNCFKYNKDFINGLGTKIKLESIDDIKLEGMTIHKSKGLTFDEVIIIGLNKKFPRDDYCKFWLMDLFKMPLPEENIADAEERRVFYVALTRTKNNVFILYNSNAKNRSRFVDEIYGIAMEKEKNNNS